jgi:protein disulfide-isomerase A1
MYVCMYIYVCMHSSIINLQSRQIFKKFDDPEVTHTGAFTKKALAAFLHVEMFPLAAPVDRESVLSKYVDRGLPILYVYAGKEQQENLFEKTKIAVRPFKGRVSALLMNGDDRLEHAKTFGLKSSTPGVVLHDMKNKNKYVLPESPTITQAQLTDFVAAYFSKKLSPHLRSEEEPATQAGPVVTLVGSSFDRIVKDQTKDVLVLLPACTHSPQYQHSPQSISVSAYHPRRV